MLKVLMQESKSHWQAHFMENHRLKSMVMLFTLKYCLIFLFEWCRLQQTEMNWYLYVENNWQFCMNSNKIIHLINLCGSIRENRFCIKFETKLSEWETSIYFICFVFLFVIYVCNSNEINAYHIFVSIVASICQKKKLNFWKIQWDT
jgi:hypothetical protein